MMTRGASDRATQVAHAAHRAHLPCSQPRVYSFGKKKKMDPSEKQKISEISGILVQNQIDLFIFK
jgi:hypothetical protein